MEHVLEAHKNGFDTDQEALLSRINEAGKEIASWIRVNKDLISKEDAKLDQFNVEIQELERQLMIAREAVNNLPPPPNPEDDPQCRVLQSKIEEVRRALDLQSSDEGRAAYQNKRKELQEEIKSWSARLAQQALMDLVDKRVEELEAQKRDIGVKLALVDRDLDLLSAYVSARCEVMEGSINAMFDTIRWKLFELQKNGEYADVCRATVNGVSYESTLNNAARINAGIEMIRVLSQAKGTNVPCFVDNVEAVNRVALTGGQMILLRVTEDPILTLTKEA
jgi:hypothetical protein